MDDVDLLGAVAAIKRTVAGKIERRRVTGVSGFTMTKLIALVVAGVFAAGTMFAGEHGDCTRKVGNEAKAACTVSFASLNLSAEQQTKMDTAMADHHKAGCTEASEAKFMKEVEGILTPEQYAKFKAQCKGEKEGSQT